MRKAGGIQHGFDLRHDCQGRLSAFRLVRYLANSRDGRIYSRRLGTFSDTELLFDE
jgi:hypothetical protein